MMAYSSKESMQIQLARGFQQVTLPSGLVTTNIYRADGLRYQKQDSSGTTRFVYDGQNYLAETDGTGDTKSVSKKCYFST
jgi:hypothetical protein